MLARLMLACLVLAGLLPAGIAGTAAAQSRHAAMVIDANNGAVLHADQADEPRYPASLTKMMTIYLALEAIERGRTSFAARVRMSEEAASAPPSKLDLEPGETISLGDAIKALVTKSANDIAVAVAEHVGGSEPRFARMMTEKARLFGMSRTTFRNASGLPDPGQVTTARDMITLALRLQDDFPRHYHLFSLRAFTYEGDTHRNHNGLLRRFQGTDGVKTGYTRASGFNVVTSVRRGGRHVIGAVFGGSTAARRDDAMQLLLSRALIKASPYKSRRSAPVLVSEARPVERPFARPSAQTAAAQAVATPARPTLAPPRPVVVQRPRPVLAMADAGQSWPQQAVPIAAPRPALVVPPAPPPAADPLPIAAVRPEPVARREPPNHGGQQRLAFLPRSFDLGKGRPAATATSDAAEVPARGAPPSTLQQQASNLARGAEAVALPPAPRPVQPASFSVRQPPVPEPAVARGQAMGGGYEVQVGAYATAVEAERALAAARGSAGEVLRSIDARAIPVRKETRQIFRARFIGLDQRSAAATCLELRRRQIDCFVMRAE